MVSDGVTLAVRLKFRPRLTVTVTVTLRVTVTVVTVVTVTVRGKDGVLGVARCTVMVIVSAVVITRVR